MFKYTYIKPVIEFNHVQSCRFVLPKPVARRDAMTPLFVRKRFHYLFVAASGIETKNNKRLQLPYFRSVTKANHLLECESFQKKLCR